MSRANCLRGSRPGAPENGGVGKTRLREGKAPGSQMAELYVDRQHQTA